MLIHREFGGVIVLDMFFQFIRDLFAFAGYLNTNSSFPEPLSPEEEKACLQLLGQGDEDARRKLIEHNLRLVAHIAKKYAAPHRDADDMISIGTVGLIKAVSTFNPGKGSALATYAARCIENEMLMSIRSDKKHCGDVPLNGPIGKDKDGNEITLVDVLGTDADCVYNIVELNIASAQLRRAIKSVLTPREQIVVALRYGLTGRRPMTQRDIAKLLGISRSYISRLEKKAVACLNKEFARMNGI
ncbi:MAG TPA: RNA polymerase sporulation sigma factor SigK [Clostridia bacterium]|nr:RNA polymerase sporulation sigma factor SigK [Clostridia bacterium]